MELIPSDYTSNYTSFKHELDTELNKAADGFVKIGYLLKVARDTDVLKDSGYNTVAEFAQAEYGLTKDTVSRYININDRFSEDGYSPVLANRFHNYGLAKLQEMLTLPDNIVEAIPEDISKEDIRTIKKEYAEEQQISDIEVAIEAAEQTTEGKKDDVILLDIIKQYFHDNPEDFIKCSDIGMQGKKEDFRDIVAPMGSKVIIGRINGKGKYIATIKDIDTKIIVSNMRDSSDKEEYTWDELVDIILVLTVYPDKTHPTSAVDMWSYVYNEPFPKQKEKDETKRATEKKKAEEKPKKKKVEVVNKKKAEVEVVPGVSVEIEDVDKANAAAKSDMKKAEIEAVPNYTDEGDEEKVAPAQPEPAQPEQAESEPVKEPEIIEQPNQEPVIENNIEKETANEETENIGDEEKPHHSKLDTERHWSEVYDIIEDQYQQLKRCIRIYDVEMALKFTVEIRTQILGLKEWPMKDDE